MKKLYCFDFDGTLTKQDTMFLFLYSYNPARFRMQFALHTPLFMMLKLKLADAERVKKSFISSIIKNESEEKIKQKAQAFFDENYPNIIRENALEFIEKMDRNKTESLLVTASLDIWVQPFAKKFGMKLLATKAEFENGKFSGNFVGNNCNGQEKVERIKQEIKDKKFDKSIAFGDTSGDKPMLDWANESYFKFFH